MKGLRGIGSIIALFLLGVSLGAAPDRLPPSPSISLSSMMQMGYQ